MIEIPKLVELFQAHASYPVREQDFCGQDPIAPLVDAVIVDKQSVMEAFGRRLRRERPYRDPVFSVVHTTDLIEAGRITNIEKPSIKTFYAETFHARPIRHAPAVFGEIDANITARHRRSRRDTPHAPVHDIELEEVRRPDIGGPLYPPFQKDQAIDTAHTAHDSLDIPASRKYLDIRLLVLGIIATRFRP